MYAGSASSRQGIEQQTLWRACVVERIDILLMESAVPGQEVENVSWKCVI